MTISSRSGMIKRARYWAGSTGFHPHRSLACNDRRTAGTAVRLPGNWDWTAILPAACGHRWGLQRFTPHQIWGFPESGIPAHTPPRPWPS